MNHMLAQGRTRIFEEIGVDNGLSSNYPNCILQDSKGFIWVGTNNGLNRYDGYTAKVYLHDEEDPSSLSSNWINALLEDAEGNIWVGTEGGGISVYYRSTGKFKRLLQKEGDSSSLGSNVVMSLFEDSMLRIWAGTKGGLSQISVEDEDFVVRNWRQRQYCSSCDYTIMSIVEDHKGNLWVGDEINGLYYFEPYNSTFSRPHLNYSGQNRLSNGFINHLYFDEGYLWVGTDDGLFLLNTLKGTYESLNIDGNDDGVVLDVFVRRIYEGPNRDLWFCSNGSGLIHYDRSEQKLNVYSSDVSSNYALGSNSIGDVIIDYSNNVWIATRGGGLNRFNLKSLVFEHYGADKTNPNSLVYNEVRALLQDPDGTLWIGTNKGLSKFESDSKKFTNYIDDFEYMADIRSPRVRMIFRGSDGMLWIATQNKGLYQQSPEGDRFILDQVYTNSPVIGQTRDINMAFEINEDLIWFGTMGSGFIEYDKKTSQLRSVISLSDHDDILTKLAVYVVLRHSEEEVWVGTNRGLFLLNTNTLEYKNWRKVYMEDNSLVYNKVRCFYRDSGNNLWIGTRGGVSRFNIVTGEFLNLTMEDGLPSEIVLGMMLGVDGNLWLTTPQGLSRLDPGTLEIKNITIPQNNTLDMGGHEVGLDGKLIVGGFDGFTIFHPKQLKSNEYVPDVVLTDIKINNLPAALDRDISEFRSIELNYDQNNITFEFSALDYTNTSANEYQYKLEGFDDDWVYFGHKHDLTFTNLNPGDYQLQIKGSNSDGLWNPVPTTLDIYIQPPFWDTWLFKIISISILISLAASFYLIRVSALQRQEKVLKEEVYRQTKELVKSNTEKDGILKIVAHDLKAPLNNIYGFNQLLRTSGKLDDELHGYANYIDQSIQAGNSLIMDLLLVSNLSHPEKRMNTESFDLSAFVQEWLPNYQASLDRKEQHLKKIGFDEPLMVNSDKKLLARIFDNLLTNAMKFSDRGGSIDLSLAANGESIHVSFKDYGPGMTEEDQENAFGMFQKLSARPTEGESSHGLGLAIVKKLVDQLNARIELNSEYGQGTEFVVCLPKA